MLYAKAANALHLAPSQHSAEPIKAILGGVMPRRIGPDDPTIRAITQRNAGREHRYVWQRVQ